MKLSFIFLPEKFFIKITNDYKMLYYRKQYRNCIRPVVCILLLRGNIFQCMIEAASMYLQRTVKKEVGAASIGLHTGRKINITIKPAGVDAGIVFLRRDLSKNNIIKAELNNVLDTHLASTIGINGTRISTVEHLLSAFSGMGL